MAPWTERFLALAIVLAGGAQVGPPGEVFVSDGARRAVLLEDGDFFSGPSSTGVAGIERDVGDPFTDRDGHFIWGDLQAERPKPLFARSELLLILGGLYEIDLDLVV